MKFLLMVWIANPTSVITVRDCPAIAGVQIFYFGVLLFQLLNCSFTVCLRRLFMKSLFGFHETLAYSVIEAAVSHDIWTVCLVSDSCFMLWMIFVPSAFRFEAFWNGLLWICLKWPYTIWVANCFICLGVLVCLCPYLITNSFCFKLMQGDIVKCLLESLEVTY